jgi:hypothetical protein
VSKDIDCYSLAKNSEFLAAADILVGTKVLDILSFAGQYNKPVQYRRESAHKSRAEVGNVSLDVYMYREQHHHQGEVGDLQRGLTEVSSCGFCQA